MVDHIQVSLSSDKHPVTGMVLSGQWGGKDFKHLPSGEELFKVVAKQCLNEQDSYHATQVSVKYQVMSKHTAFIGVSKNDEKPTEVL